MHAVGCVLEAFEGSCQGRTCRSAATRCPPTPPLSRALLAPSSLAFLHLTPLTHALHPQSLSDSCTLDKTLHEQRHSVNLCLTLVPSALAVSSRAGNGHDFAWCRNSGSVLPLEMASPESAGALRSAGESARMLSITRAQRLERVGAGVARGGLVVAHLHTCRKMLAMHGTRARGCG